MKPNHKPIILWSMGTAYDLYASLHVLHHPDRFGLRASWAAGVRSRLSPAQRNTLEISQKLFFNSPVGWVSGLAEPRDAASVLGALVQIEPINRLSVIAFHADLPAQVWDLLNNVSLRGNWSTSDLEHMDTYFRLKQEPPTHEELVSVLNHWSNPGEFGEGYLAALQAYVEVFFDEEEKRIGPFLQPAMDRAQELAARLDFQSLMVELSQGVKIAAFEEADEVTFIPSYWITPLVMFDTRQPGHWSVLFGARPPEVGLVPGELVPDAMLRAMKALSDPTRLLILRYLRDKPQTPTQLARQLRLRAPTVIHHLNALRLAGLVYISMGMDEEKRYTVRPAALSETFASLSRFIADQEK